MEKKTELTGLSAFVILAIYILISVIGLRYGILLGFDKDIGILSPIILVITYHWLSIAHYTGKKK